MIMVLNVINQNNTTTKPLNQNRMKTAVEWLVEQICGDHTEQWQKEIEQAKEMEKEQIMQAFEAAEKYCGKDFLHGDLYYNETFKSE